MLALPTPEAIEDEPFVKVAFQDAYLQGEDQAKALIKNGYHTDPCNTLPYLLFVGPYWAPVIYGPFSEDELSVRTNISESADWKASRRFMVQEPPKRSVYVLGTKRSRARLAKLFSETDVHFHHVELEASSPSISVWSTQDETRLENT